MCSYAAFWEESVWRLAGLSSIHLRKARRRSKRKKNQRCIQHVPERETVSPPPGWRTYPSREGGYGCRCCVGSWSNGFYFQTHTQWAIPQTVLQFASFSWSISIVAGLRPRFAICWHGICYVDFKWCASEFSTWWCGLWFEWVGSFSRCHDFAGFHQLCLFHIAIFRSLFRQQTRMYWPCYHPKNK